MGEVLDDEFKQIISRMKPHAKKLPQKSGEFDHILMYKTTSTDYLIYVSYRGEK